MPLKVRQNPRTCNVKAVQGVPVMKSITSLVHAMSLSLRQMRWTTQRNKIIMFRH